MGADDSTEALRRVEAARRYGRFQACYVHFDVQALREIGIVPSVLIVTSGGRPRIRELLLETFKLTGGAPDDAVLHQLAQQGLYREQGISLDREGVY